VNGDEVRDTRFLGPTGKFTRGYDAAEVDELLGRIAAELDAGRQVRPLIENAVFRARTGTGGYDAQAVDWFLEQLRCREGHSELGPGVPRPGVRGRVARLRPAARHAAAVGPGIRTASVERPAR
jgi:DivIVA domain-containing protein